MGEDAAPIVKEAKISVGKSGAVESFDIVESEQGLIPTVTFNNAGNLSIELGGTIEIYKEGSLVASKPLDTLTALPKKSTKIDAGPLKGLEEGTYNIKAIVTYGGKSITKEIEYKIR
jgi:hypothetical protein